MRLSREDLFKITRLHRPKSQAAWFLEYFGVKVPCDKDGPILTELAYEAIVAKRLGVFPKTEVPPMPGQVQKIELQTPRPAKRLASVPLARVVDIKGNS